jgi:transposase-like protein
MPRPFSPEFKEQALLQLEINDGNLARTAAELGISDRSLLRWRQQSPTTTTTTTTTLGTQPEIPENDLQALMSLKARLIQAADYISVSIIPAVEDAPLGQRVSALAQLIDRIIKLAAQLPVEEEEMELSDDVEEVDDEEDA